MKDLDLGFIKSALPFWDQLEEKDIDLLETRLVKRTFEKGQSVHDGGDCTGLVLVKEGQLRTFILSETGREITLFRLFEWDVCILTSSCVMKNISFDINAEAEKDTEIYLLAAEAFKKLAEGNAAVKDFNTEIISSRLSDLMWVVEQVVFKSLDQRLANFLLDMYSIEGRCELHITHDAIARNIGSAREAVTRMLKYFQDEGILSLSRGQIRLNKLENLQTIADS